MSRLTFITLLSIVILALASLVHWQGNQIDDAISQQQQDNNEADFFMTHAVTTQFDATGGIDHSLAADEIKHFPANDITRAESPDITFFRANGTAWDISAEQGRITEKNNVIDLWNDVEISRNTPPNELNFKTSKLTIVASKNLAHTDQDVLIIDNSTHINATGMKAYLEENKIKFLSNVRVIHDPAKVN